MTAAQIQAAAASILARRRESGDLVVVAVEQYGQRRLYPATPSAEILARLVGATTIDERHLALAKALAPCAITTRVVTLDALVAEEAADAAAIATQVEVGAWIAQATAASIVNRPRA
jgi:hypothetical protein